MIGWIFFASTMAYISVFGYGAMNLMVGIFWTWLLKHLIKAFNRYWAKWVPLRLRYPLPNWFLNERQTSSESKFAPKHTASMKLRIGTFDQCLSLASKDIMPEAPEIKWEDLQPKVPTANATS